MNGSLKDFTLANILIGMLTFGGGASFIPLFNDFYIKKYQFISAPSFYELYAYGSAMPGPISPILAGTIGWQCFGSAGFILGLGALIVPAMLLTVAVYHYYKKFKNHPFLINLSKYTMPFVLGVLFSVVIEISEKYIALHNFEPVNFLMLTIIPAVIIGKFKKNPLYAIAANICYSFIFIK